MPFRIPQAFPDFDLQRHPATDKELEEYVNYLERELQMALHERGLRARPAPVPHAPPVPPAEKPKSRRSASIKASWQKRKALVPQQPDEVTAALAGAAANHTESTGDAPGGD